MKMLEKKKINEGVNIFLKLYICIIFIKYYLLYWWEK